MKPSSIRDRLALRDSFLEFFRKIATTKERHKRLDMVGNELGWVVYERETMYQAVNRERAKLGKTNLDLQELMKVERSAFGHSDYASKFALGCMELVLDKE